MALAQKVFLLFFLVTFFINCKHEEQHQNIESLQEEHHQDIGSLKVNFSYKHLSQKTLTPNFDMNIEQFRITLTDAANENHLTYLTNDNSYTISELLFGEWTISIQAENNSGEIILSGSDIVTVNTGETSIVNMILLPVIDGHGQLNLTITYPNEEIQSPNIDAELINSNNEHIPLNFTIETGQATFNGEIPPGHYTLIIKLLDNLSVTMGAVEIVKIMSGATTNGEYQFGNVNQAGGNIQINITPDFQNPLEVNISGGQDYIYENQSLSLSGSINDSSLPDINYIWYINGDSYHLGETVDLNSLNPGTYRVDLVAFQASGQRAGSTTLTFNVLPINEIFIPDPIFDLNLNEGLGLQALENMTMTYFNSIDTNINWNHDQIKGSPSKAYIQSGSGNNNTGVIEGHFNGDTLNEYTITFLTRITTSGRGAILRSIDHGLHFRFWDGAWDLSGGVSSLPEDTLYGKWVRVTFVQNSTTQMFYIDDKLSGTLEQVNPLPSGAYRIGAFVPGSYFYPGEYTDFEIYNIPFTHDQVRRRNSLDGINNTYFNLSDGSDWRGLWKREEHSAVYNSIISLDEGRYNHWFNGDTCWGALSKMIPINESSLWFSADFFYPSNLSANHDFGPTVQTIGLYNDTGRNNPVAILYLNHERNTNELTLGRISYRNSTSGVVNINLDGREIQKDRNYRFEIYYEKGEEGSIAFYLDGEELYHQQDNFDLDIIQAMYGLNLGIHPQTPGDIIYSDNIYVGRNRLSL